MKKEFIRLAGILCAITLVAALLLACVNKITAPKIENAAKKASEDAMRIIISDADKFETIDEEKRISAAKKDGEIIGYCVTVNVSGFGGPLEMMVGIGTDNIVKGIDILSHSETAGLGAKADTADFKERFKGKKPSVNIVKTPTSDEGKVQAITGATITSDAVSEGIKMAYNIIQETQGEGQ